MRQAPEQSQLAPAPAVFGPFDVVALQAPYAELDAGMWGNVLAVEGDGMVEVEFMERDGAPLTVVGVPAELLSLVWADPG